LDFNGTLGRKFTGFKRITKIFGGFVHNFAKISIFPTKIFDPHMQGAFHLMTELSYQGNCQHFDSNHRDKRKWSAIGVEIGRS
jgi:hypothetical protein